ncbi:MAG: fibronectin type III domain-containing protein, partial [Candidatus Paceibacterota bacterium]
WTTDLDADSYVEYGTSISYGQTFGNGALTKNHSIALPADLAASTTYHFRVHSSDAGKNEGVSIDYVFQTTATPIPDIPIITNVSASSISYNTATVTWTTDLDADSYVEYGTSISYGQTFGNGALTKNHSIALPADLAASTTYHFRVHSSDAGKNEGVSGDYDFQTIAVPIPGVPAITNVSVGSIAYNTATITWNTDISSNSYVEYGTNTSYGRIYGNNTLTKNHSIALPSDLAASTAYHFRVRSSDAGKNEGISADYNFQTIAGIDMAKPIISNVGYSNVGETAVTISWDTDENTNSIVYLGTTTNYSFIGGDDSASVQNHAVDVPGLSPDTTYHFQIMSRDGSGNVSYSSDSAFTTLALVGAPQILSGPAEDQLSDTSVHIRWTTDQSSNSQIFYGTSADDLRNSLQIQEQTLSHDVLLTGLSAQTQYFYKAVSFNAVAVSVESEVRDFTTAVDAEHNHPPLSKIENVGVNQKATSAIATFNTDQNAICSVEYRIEGQDYSGLIESEDGYNTNHGVALSNLIPKTKYFIRITCNDNLDPPTVVKYGYAPDPDFSFTTNDSSGNDGDSDTTPPSISGIKTGKTSTGSGVLVSWSTDEVSSSFVRFGLTKDLGDIAGDDLVSFDMAKFVTSHEVAINNVTSNTKYFYSIVSADKAGNIAQSAVSTFTASSSSNLSSIKIEATSLSEASVTWTTNVAASSVVEYGTTATYGQSKQDSSLVKEHKIIVSGLIQSTVYHIRVRSKDKDDKEYASSDYTFSTKAPPSITGIKVSEITENGATVSFSTNVATDSVVQYADMKDPKNTGSQGSPELLTNHKVVMQGITPGTTFTMKIKVRDEAGNEAVQDAPNFSTKKDETAPKIDQVRVESALAQNDKVQAIISWTTDEDATTRVIYREGKNGEDNELGSDGGFSKTHTSVVTNFKPGVIYFFNVKSTDKYGNETASDTYATLTPKKKENIIQIIINNFQEIFKWTNV